VVECDLAKVEVAGSTPVSRSILFHREVHEAPRSLGNLFPSCPFVPFAVRGFWVFAQIEAVSRRERGVAERVLLPKS
jgi:hypothetical protein